MPIVTSQGADFSELCSITQNFFTTINECHTTKDEKRLTLLQTRDACFLIIAALKPSETLLLTWNMQTDAERLHAVSQRLLPNLSSPVFLIRQTLAGLWSSHAYQKCQSGLLCCCVRQDQWRVSGLCRPLVSSRNTFVCLFVFISVIGIYSCRLYNLSMDSEMLCCSIWYEWVLHPASTRYAKTMQ